MFKHVRDRLRLLSLVQQFKLASLAILVSGMFLIGWWVGQQIKRGVINRTAATTALYVDSFISPKTQELGQGNRLTEEHRRTLDKLLRETPLGQQIVTFKIWNSYSRIIYSTNPSVIGLIFPANKELARALGGEITSRISDLREPENELERNEWNRLIETYSPVRQKGSDRIIAVAEFYQTVDDLQREITTAQTRSWLIVGAATVIMYILLVGMVRRGSDTISRQQAELHEKVAQLSNLLAQNQKLHERVRRAATRTTTLNERFLRRISAELHDGPAQDLGLALLQLDGVIASCEDYAPVHSDGRQINEFLNTIQSSLEHALQEVRVISAGLQLPELDDLTLEETLIRVVRMHERRTDAKVSLNYNQLPEQSPLPVKITLYRLIQEALTNAARHGGVPNQQVRVRFEADNLNVLISDRGPGFDMSQVAGQDDHLGLAGMRERVESLGGIFRLETKLDHGTRVIADLPLYTTERNGE